MAGPPWPDRLREELRKRRLPRAYSARLIEELTDHLADVKKEDRSMDAQSSGEERLGSPELLASVAQREMNRRSLVGRHPFVAFTLSPIPIAFLSLILIAVAGKAWWWLTTEVIHWPGGAAWLGPLVETYVLRAVPFVFAWLFIRLSRRVGRPEWGLLSCSLMSFLALNIRPDVKPDFTAVIPLGGFLGVFLAYQPDKAIQAALPLVLGLWSVWRMRDRPTNSPFYHDPGPSRSPVQA
jgi:hypothetical protein